MNAEHRATDLHHDLRLLEKLSSDSLRAMADTQKELSQVGTDNNQLLSKGKDHYIAGGVQPNPHRLTMLTN